MLNIINVKSNIIDIKLIKLDLYKNIALKINSLIEQKKLTIGGLAERIHLTKQTLHYNMNGKTKFSIENLDKIAKFFEVPISHFFEESDQNPKINIVKEKAAEYSTISDQLKMKDDQIKAKDDQIKFLQHLIDKEY